MTATTRGGGRWPKVAAGTAALAITMFGCNRGPKRVEVPGFDADQIGVRAIELYDRDGDGALAAAERREVKSLDSAMNRLDTNRDGNLSAEEIAARIEFYYEFKAGLLPTYCTLLHAGRPVGGAKVTYEPEEFMGESALPAFGTTNPGGTTIISMADENLPNPNLSGVQPGFYRIRVTLADGTEVTDLNAGAETAGDMLNNHTFVLP